MGSAASEAASNPSTPVKTKNAASSAAPTRAPTKSGRGRKRKTFEDSTTNTGGSPAKSLKSGPFENEAQDDLGLNIVVKSEPADLFDP